MAWHEAVPSTYPLDPIEPLLDMARLLICWASRCKPCATGFRVVGSWMS
jgi:hypothetical protein